MDISVTDENILGHITEFQEITDEYKTINKDILSYKKKYEKRLKELKSKIEEKENIILQYMKMNNHPGINYKGMLITLSKKKIGNRQSVEKREKVLDDILRKYNVDMTNPLHHDLKETLRTSKEMEKIKVHNSS